MRDGHASNKVMIADDNTFIRFLVKKLLGPYAEVIEVARGDDVMAAYMEARPDILFLDIHLPGKSGLAVINEIAIKDPESYVVMMSADSMRDNVITAAKAGAKAFITKPFKRATLLKYFRLCPTIEMPEGAEEASTEETEKEEA